MNRNILFVGILAVGISGCGTHPATAPEPEASSVAPQDKGSQSGATSSDTTGAPVKNESATTPGTNAPGTATSGSGTPGKGGKKGESQKASLGWVPSSDSPETLVKEMEQSIASKRSLTVKTKYNYKTSKGHGFSNGESSIKGPSTFRLEYPTIGQAHQMISSEILVADGTNAGYIRGVGAIPKIPLNQLSWSSSVEVEKWIETYPKFLYQPIRGGHPFSDALALLRQNPKHSTIKVEERAFDYKGHRVVQKRIVSHLALPGKPTLDFGIVIDMDHKLPVTIAGVNDWHAPSEVNTELSIDWNLEPNQKFAADKFMIPLRTEVTAPPKN